MLRFAARRLLALPATLLFIALAGFGLVQLLPGDPALARADLAGARGLSAEDVARLRATYGLDLPVFYNAEVLDRGRDAARLVEALRDPARRGEARRDLRERGTAVLPELVRNLDAPGALEVAREILGLPAAGAQDLSAAWAALRGSLPARVKRFIAEPTPSNAEAVRRSGTAAVPLLAEEMLGGRGDAGATARLLGILAGFATPSGEDPRRAFAAWWRENRLRYIDLGSWDRFWAALTETRFGRWLGRLVRLDLGTTHDGRPVRSLLSEALPVTLLLGLLALACAYAVAVPLGALVASRRGGVADRASLGLTLTALALPAPWVAVGLISLLGALPVDILPIQGLTSPGADSWGFWARAADLAWHLVAPVACLTYGTAALLLRYERGAVLASLGEPFVQAARARGLPERTVIFRHALRASLGPALSLLSVELPWVLSGSVVVETAFEIPGMGLLTWKALTARDYPTLLGAVMVLALVALAASLLSDLLAAWADPRIRLSRRRT
jgi:peptide/nickel transport system permease protein